MSQTADRFAGLHPALIPGAAALFNAATAAGLRPRLTSVRRSRTQQEVLYSRYLRGLSRLPAAPPGRSMHEYGLAWDMVADDLERIGRTWISWGGEWFPSDPVHFQYGGRVPEYVASVPGAFVAGFYPDGSVRWAQPSSNFRR